MLTYNEAIDYLFNQRPAFERQGAGGYKPGLDTTITLDNLYGNPHKSFKIIHVAGTNGKGSVSSLIAATLQSQGYKTGLYTSPHFVDFTERIKVDGKQIPHDRVVEFVDDFRNRETTVEPSFFELTTILAFKYFEECNVDYAVVEVGLGGRLDSTNIVTPILSVITNISIDHTEFLGDTLTEIAAEKAGIIKPGVPVVVGEVMGEVKQVFNNKADEHGAEVVYALDVNPVNNITNEKRYLTVETKEFGNIHCQLTGEYQVFNINTALTAIHELRRQGVDISADAVAFGFAHVCDITGIRGRWTVVGESPFTVCDSAHNTAGISLAMMQLDQLDCTGKHMVMGVMADKDLIGILPLLPRDAVYYFTQASTPRALKADRLKEMAGVYGFNGNHYTTVAQAYEAARSNARETDVIYVGGSMYVLAEFFEYIDSVKDLTE